MTDDGSWWRCTMMIDDDSYDVWPMMVHDDDVRWCMTDDGSWWWCTMMISDVCRIMDHDDDVWWCGHGCDLDDRLMMALELWYVWSLCSMFMMILTWMIETFDSYNKGTCYLSRCISTSCVDSLGMTSSSISRSLGRLTEYHLHQLLFFSFYLHQLQPSSASTSASSFFQPVTLCHWCQRGRDVLVRGSLLSIVINDKGGDCWSV